MVLNKAQHGAPFSVTATDATHAVATQSAVAAHAQYITDISASSDKAGAIILVKTGTTTIWQDIVGASFYSRSFTIPLGGVMGDLVSVEIDSTSAGKANIAGFTL